MAAVILRPGAAFDGKKLFEHARRDLPAYARPLFIRLQVSARVARPHSSEMWVVETSAVRLPPPGGDGDDQHLQAAEVPAGAEWIRPLQDPGPPLRPGLPAGELRSSDGRRLPEHPVRRAQALDSRVQRRFRGFPIFGGRHRDCGSEVFLRLTRGNVLSNILSEMRCLPGIIATLLTWINRRVCLNLGLVTSFFRR